LPLLSELDALAHLPRLVVDDAQALVLQRGQPLAWAALAAGSAADGPACAVRQGAAGQVLVAIVARDGQDGVQILRGFHGRL
jgi:hypothetical protein